jgi:nucleoside-diphosphate-sugar epimerase
VSIARIFQVYGEGEPAGRLWPALSAAALAGADYPMTAGEQIRDFIDVGSVAKQLLSQTENSQAAAGVPSVLHIGTGHSKTVREFAEQVWADHNASGRLLVGAIPYRANEIMRYVPQIG